MTLNPSTVWIRGGCCYMYFQVVLIGTKLKGNCVDFLHLLTCYCPHEFLREHPSFVYTWLSMITMIDRRTGLSYARSCFLYFCFLVTTFDNNRLITRYIIHISHCQRSSLYSNKYTNTTIESTRVD